VVCIIVAVVLLVGIVELTAVELEYENVVLE